jgi:hypothetical protein
MLRSICRVQIHRGFPVLVLGLVLGSKGLSAQTTAEQSSIPQRFEISQAQEFLRAAIQDPQEEADPRQGAAWRNRLLTGLGAGLLGAGIGFFASQLAESDWDETLGGYKADRSPWALVGGGVGFAVGFSFPIAPGPPSGPSLPRGRNRDLISYEEIQEALSQPIGQQREHITAAEMRRAVVTDGLELVRLLRPDWLVQRGVSTFGDPDTETIRVYLDNQELGGIEALELVQVTVIRSVRFLNSARATALFGAGHTQGVIQVLTQD